jgi:hypothetical protein
MRAPTLCRCILPAGVVRRPLAIRSRGADHREHPQADVVLGHVNSQAISKCRALPELVRATVPLAGSEAEAVRRVALVQQELKLTLSEMREACRALKAAADSGLGIPAGKLVPSTERKKRRKLHAIKMRLMRRLTVHSCAPVPVCNKYDSSMVLLPVLTCRAMTSSSARCT